MKNVTSPKSKATKSLPKTRGGILAAIHRNITNHPEEHVRVHRMAELQETLAISSGFKLLPSDIGKEPEFLHKVIFAPVKRLAAAYASAMKINSSNIIVY